MSLINSRVHSNTAAHAFLTRSIQNFEAACNRVAKLVRLKAPSAPLPSIHDAVAQCLEGDSTITAEFMSPDCNETFIREVATVVASTFGRDRADFEPDQRAIAKVVGSRLAANAFPLLSLPDKLSIVRSLSREDAIGLCVKKIEHKRAMLRESLADVEIPISTTAAERAASQAAGTRSWKQQAEERNRARFGEKVSA